MKNKTTFYWPRAYFPALVVVTDGRSGKEFGGLLKLDGNRLVMEEFMEVKVKTAKPPSEPEPEKVPTGSSEAGTE